MRFLRLGMLLGILTGCATSMPLVPGKSWQPSITEGLGIFKLTTLNEHTRYLLEPDTLEVKETQAGKTTLIGFNDPERELGNRGYEFLGSLALPAGEYYLTQISGSTDTGLVAILPVRGKFDPHFEKKFRVQAGETVYLGHWVMRLVKKTSSAEERAGPILPLVDQSATGMSDGTFKLEIQDEYAADVALFRQKYPSLVTTEITKRLLQ
jgi:hypothetical protein